MTLNTRAWLSLLALALVTGLLVFGVAGTLHYWQAWLYFAVFFGATMVVTSDIMRRDPALLARRIRGGPFAERDPRQRLISVFISLGFIGLMVVPALDHRFGWSSVPTVLALSGNAATIVGFYVVARAYRVNSFTSAIIEVVPGQHVISTGPYALVRHPMYAGSALYLLGTPLALGSRWAFLVLVAMSPFLLWRLLEEERLLARQLPGYQEYLNRVRYRLVPRVW